MTSQNNSGIDDGSFSFSPEGVSYHLDLFYTPKGEGTFRLDVKKINERDVPVELFYIKCVGGVHRRSRLDPYGRLEELATGETTSISERAKRMNKFTRTLPLPLRTYFGEMKVI